MELMRMNDENGNGRERSGEAGFTLVEALVAIVVLVFGLIAVTNLMLVAASSNSVANQGTAATSAASEALEALKAKPWGDASLSIGGSLTADVPVGGINYFTNRWMPGVGRINTRWTIENVAGSPDTLFITVQSQGTGALSVGRSRAVFTTIRACTVVPC